MKRITSILCLVALPCVLSFAQGSGNVDAGDMPRQDPTMSQDQVRDMVNNPDSGKQERAWKDAENRFMGSLTNGERQNYQEMKQVCDQIRSQIATSKGEMAGKTFQERAQAIEALKAQVKTQLQNLENQIQTRLNDEQKQARSQKKAEVAQKRQEMDKLLEQVRDRIQERTGGNR